MTRSDINDTANQLLRHEKQIFSRLVNDLINTVKQKSAGFLEGARVSPRDLLLFPDFIFDETSHAADVSRNVLVLDNLEEKHFFALTSTSLNLAHFKCAVKTIAKFHAVGICHKLMLLHSFEQQTKAAEQKKTFEDIEVEGEGAYFCKATSRHYTLHVTNNRNISTVFIWLLCLPITYPK